MKVYSWIHLAETAFQEKTSGPDMSAADQKRISDQLTERWVDRLDPNDDVWAMIPTISNILHPVNRASGSSRK